MPSIFTRIIKKEIPCEKILEDERYFAFLDIRPINPGHCLVIPKQEVDYLFDLEDEPLAGLSVFAKKIARAIKKAIPCERVGVLVAGLEVPHAHIHLVPIQGEGDLVFSRATAASQDELRIVGEKIRRAMES